jgi:trehalose 6-phosphate phosphatase
VALVTGRPARTAVRLGGFAGRAGLESMVVLGQYGVERWDGATGSYTIPPEPAEVTAAGEELPAILASLGLEDARVEHKGRALGVHTRQLADPRAAFDALSGPMRDLAARHGLLLEPGRNVLEIRAGGSDKGGALRDLVAETGARQVVFAGDDLGDLPAFETVAALRAEGVAGLLVCSASPEEDALRRLADVVVDGPAGVAAWLRNLAARLRAG